MAKAKKKFQLNSDILRILMLVVGSIFTTLVLAFSVIAIIEINHGNYANAPKYLFWIFIFLSFTRLVTFIKDRTKINFIRCAVLLTMDLAIGIIVLFANGNPYLFSICGGLYCLTIIVCPRLIIINRKPSISNSLSGKSAITCMLSTITISSLQKV